MTMEKLLSLSFANLSSKTPQKVSKGLRQIEGLLAQICLSNPSPTRLNDLQSLSRDPAFREYFKLQERFEWNVATKLMICLERLLGVHDSDSNNDLVAKTVGLLHGILLVHPPSRDVVGSEVGMNLLLDLLDIAMPPAVQTASLLALSTAILGCPANARAFEKSDGLQTLAYLRKEPSTTEEVKMHVANFVALYLLPDHSVTKATAQETDTMRHKPLKLTTPGVIQEKTDDAVRTAEEKRIALAAAFEHTDELVGHVWTDVRVTRLPPVSVAVV